MAAPICVCLPCCGTISVSRKFPRHPRFTRFASLRSYSLAKCSRRVGGLLRRSSALIGWKPDTPRSSQHTTMPQFCGSARGVAVENLDSPYQQVGRFGRTWKRCLETTKSVLALAVFPRTLCHVAIHDHLLRNAPCRPFPHPRDGRPSCLQLALPFAQRRGAVLPRSKSLRFTKTRAATAAPAGCSI
jgi:hypothetical protein